MLWKTTDANLNKQNFSMTCKPDSTHHMACDCREAQFRKMEKGLRDIIKHLEVVAGNASHLSSTWQIAKQALDEYK